MMRLFLTFSPYIQLVLVFVEKKTTLETLQVTETKKDRQTGIYKYGEEEAIKGLLIKLVTLENKTQISVLFVGSNLNTVNRKFTW